jgi:hypothetical protein
MLYIQGTSRVSLEKLSVAHLFMKFTLYRTRNFISVFTKLTTDPILSWSHSESEECRLHHFTLLMFHFNIFLSSTPLSFRLFRLQYFIKLYQIQVLTYRIKHLAGRDEA